MGLPASFRCKRAYSRIETVPRAIDASLAIFAEPVELSDDPAPVFKPPTKVSAFGVVRLHWIENLDLQVRGNEAEFDHRRACNRFPAILTSPVRPCDGFASLPNASPPLAVLFDPALDFALARQFPMDCRVGDCQPHAKVGSAKTVDKRFPQRGDAHPRIRHDVLRGGSKVMPDEWGPAVARSVGAIMHGAENVVRHLESMDHGRRVSAEHPAGMQKPERADRADGPLSNRSGFERVTSCVHPPEGGR